MTNILTNLNHFFNDPSKHRSVFLPNAYIRLNMLYISPVTVQRFKKKLDCMGLKRWMLNEQGFTFRFEDVNRTQRHVNNINDFRSNTNNNIINNNIKNNIINNNIKNNINSNIKNNIDNNIDNNINKNINNNINKNIISNLQNKESDNNNNYILNLKNKEGNKQNAHQNIYKDTNELKHEPINEYNNKSNNKNEEYSVYFKGTVSIHHKEGRVFSLELDFEPVVSKKDVYGILYEIESYLKGSDAIFFMCYDVDIDEEIVSNPLYRCVDYLYKRIEEKRYE